MLLYPLDSPGKNTGVGCHALLQRIFLTQGSNPGLHFHLHQEALSSSSLSAIKVVSSAYLSLSIFLPELLIPACDSSSLAFCMMYSACKLSKTGDNIQVFMYSFPNLEPVCCSMSSSIHFVLEWVDMPSSRGSSQPRDQTQVSHIAGRFFTN